MSEDSLSLRTFILGDPPNAALSQCVASVTAALGTSLFDVRRFDWSSLAGEISEKLEQMFDIRLTDILAAARKDYQALLDCADPSKHTAEETISLAQPMGFCCVVHRPAKLSLRQPGVTWTRLAFRKSL